MSDPRQVLGVGPGAGPEEIRAAFRRACAKWHPDRNPDDPKARDRLREATQAYEALTHDDGLGPFHQGSAAWRPAASEDPFDAIASIVGSFFSGILGDRPDGPSRRPAGPGRDIRIDLSVGPLDARHGVTKSANIACEAACRRCAGEGTMAGKRDRCPACSGRGAVGLRAVLFTVSATCAICKGSGSVPAEPCPACLGTGRVKAVRAVSLAIPAGTKDGTRLRYTGMGEPGLGGAANGDLLVDVRVL